MEISRSERWLRVYYAGKLAKEYPICAGAGDNTPTGHFHIQSKAEWPSWRAYWGEYMPGGSARNPLGARWLGTSARGRVTGWPIGLHGTNDPSSIGRRISGGCVRTYNENAIELYDTVPIGTPLWIHE
jgi:lipoprotein-anchoring transpeptidase ErfK/SrfK